MTSVDTEKADRRVWLVRVSAYVVGVASGVQLSAVVWLRGARRPENRRCSALSWPLLSLHPPPPPLPDRPQVPPYIAERWKAACNQADTSVDDPEAEEDGSGSLGKITIATLPDGSTRTMLELPGACASLNGPQNRQRGVAVDTPYWTLVADPQAAEQVAASAPPTSHPQPPSPLTPHPTIHPQPPSTAPPPEGMYDASLPRSYTLQPSADMLDMSVVSSEAAEGAGASGGGGSSEAAAAAAAGEAPRLVKPRELRFSFLGPVGAGCARVCLAADLSQHPSLYPYNPTSTTNPTPTTPHHPPPTHPPTHPPHTPRTPPHHTGLDGRVSQKYDAVPAQSQGGAPAAVDDAYRALTRKRTLASLQKGRSVSVITDGRAAQRLYQQQHNRASLYVKQTAAGREEYEARSARDLKAPASNRRVRMERPELEQLLFRLFERQAHWALPALQRETDQPGGWLREVLGEVALQVKRGPHKDLWELQRQFKVGGGGAAVGAAGGGGGGGGGA